MALRDNALPYVGALLIIALALLIIALALLIIALARVGPQTIGRKLADPK